MNGKTCVWCGVRDVAGVCDEGYPSCEECLSPVPDTEPEEPLSSREMVLEIVQRFPGASTAEVIAAAIERGLHVQDPVNAVSVALCYLIKRGGIVADSRMGKKARLFYPVEGFKYKVLSTSKWAEDARRRRRERVARGICYRCGERKIETKADICIRCRDRKLELQAAARKRAA